MNWSVHFLEGLVNFSINAFIVLLLN
jgi:hypothetical protein